MKKIYLSILGLSILAAFSFTSCKKDYTCECTVSGQKLTLSLEKYKKNDAKDACDAAQVTYRNGDPAATCDLK
jgi:hypothetical protein